MYAQFYKLKKEPFHITPDPEFLFLGKSHKEALASIVYGIESKKGFIAITGGVGLGKTTILRSYLETVQKDEKKIIYIFNPNIPFKGLVKTICKEMEVRFSDSSDIVDMVNTLHEALIEEYRKGVNVILIVDEAQNMPVETLENLRMLSNLETSTDKLIQIVLVGQPELEAVLDQNELRQLKQRIAIRSRITPLDRDESVAYINHRLGKVALNGNPVFTQGALSKIVDKADGVPRVINILCDNALITGYGYQKNPVTEPIVREVIGDMKGRRENHFLKWWFAAISFILLFAGMFVMFNQRVKYFIFSKQQRMPLQQVTDNLRQTGTSKTAAGRQAIQNNNQAAATFSNGKASSNNRGPRKRIAKKGDTLTSLILETYGRIDADLLNFIKENNPGIKDSNLIIVGTEIVFPELTQREDAAGKQAH